MNITSEQSKINTEISKELDINQLKVEKAIAFYYRGIADLIKKDEPCEIRMPKLGKLEPNKYILKKLNEKHEADNSGGRLPSI